MLNRQAFDLADAHGDPQVLDEVDEQLRTIRLAVERKVDALVAGADAAAAQQDYAQAYQIAHTSTDLLNVMHDPALQAKLDEAAVAYGWQWGIQLLSATPEAAERLPELFKSLSDAMLRQSDTTGAQVAQVIAERYRTLPHGIALSHSQVGKLIRYIDHYLEILAPLTLDPSAFVFVEHWLEEAFDRLGTHADLYYDWAIMAQTYVALNDYPWLDERLWDLENRTELAAGPQWKVETTLEPLLKFAAFIDTYNGDAAAASVTWEKLGQTRTGHQPGTRGRRPRTGLSTPAPCQHADSRRTLDRRQAAAPRGAVARQAKPPAARRTPCRGRTSNPPPHRALRRTGRG